MRFLIEVLDKSSNSATELEMVEIGNLNDSLKENGNWIMACGIDSVSRSLLIDNRNDLSLISSETHSSSSEYVSGFWLIEVANDDQALRIAKSASKACNRRVELRPVL